jgi:hypothetical protein
MGRAATRLPASVRLQAGVDDDSGENVKRNPRAFMKTSDLKLNPANPRKITEEQLAALRASLKEFGDLSGIVRNVTSGNLVGGHQRVKIFADAPVTVTQRYKEPSPNGTVAVGYVTAEGERHVYREVQWDDAKEKAAMIAANKHGGDWEMSMLSDLLLELDQANFNVSLTGFSAAELERMITRFVPEDSDTMTPLDKDQIAALPAHVRMVQLFLNIETLPPFMEWVKALQGEYGTDNVTDTVYRAVETCYNTLNGKPPRLPTTAQRRSARNRPPDGNGAE